MPNSGCGETVGVNEGKLLCTVHCIQSDFPKQMSEDLDFSMDTCFLLFDLQPMCYSVLEVYAGVLFDLKSCQHIDI